MIIVPHCDDETLGCGGLIAGLVRKGAKVKVAIVTNGDGFYYAAARDLRDPFVLPENYISFGYERQRESVNALGKLGVKKDSIVFLGYPDKGLAALWLYYWKKSRPYKSQFTNDSYSPYYNAHRRNTPYAGRALLSDIESIICDYKPTTVYYPHTNDQHSDHWAVNCFVTQSLYELNMIGKVRSGLYIVHRGDWPVPQGFHPTLPMSPPASLTKVDTKWFSLPVDKEIALIKDKAIKEYKTQLPVSKRFLMSFMRINEIYGEYNPSYISYGENMDWSNVTPCVYDPVGDGLNLDIGRNGDIKLIQSYFDEQFLNVRITYNGKCLRRMAYGIRIHGLPDPKGRIVNLVQVNGKTKGPGRVVCSGNTVTASIPLSRLGRWDALMVSADSTFGQYQIDRAAWRLALKKDIPKTVTPNPHQVENRLP
ncbi:MAG: PIG-L deacetylase family protein [Armatimonadota bacterium]